MKYFQNSIKYANFVKPKSRYNKMDNTKKYSIIIQKVLEEFVATRKSSKNEIQTLLLCDTVRHHYQIVRMGWPNEQQVFNVIFHIDLIDGKIWVQRNMSDYDIVGDIEVQGVPKKDIVLAFHIPEMRAHTAYALA